MYDHKDMLQKEIVSSFSPIKMMFVVMFEERINYEIDIKLWFVSICQSRQTQWYVWVTQGKVQIQSQGRYRLMLKVAASA